MKCPSCGSNVALDAAFCGECGTRLKAPAPQMEERQPLDIAALRTIDAEAETRSSGRAAQKIMEKGEVFADRYEIDRLVGEGGMGVVYRARDKLTEQDVALKLIRADRLAGKDAVKRLIREGVTSRDIRHRNVVAVYDVGEYGGQPFMSMEFLAGQSLRAWNRQRMQSGADCSMATASKIIAEILSGLEAAHSAGVVHRDLKPENVMLSGEPTEAGVKLKILDFGVARAAGAGDTGATSLGTRGYMAPEQITAPDAAQPSADLYSLSVMFYELLVGVVPQGHWQPPSEGRTDVPPAIDQLIQRGLSNNPRARPQSTEEYGQILAQAMTGAPGGAGVGAGVFDQWLKKLDTGQLNTIVDDLKKNFVNNTGKPDAASDPGSVRAGNMTIPPAPKRNYWQWFNYSLYKRYADGKGRAHRKEYWSFIVFAIILVIVAVMVDESAGLVSYDYDTGTPIYPLAIVCYLALIAPMIAVTSRRLHDFGMTGWLAILTIIPGLGALPGIVIGLPPGSKGDNTYGPDPLAGQ